MDRKAALQLFPAAAVYTNPDLLAAFHNWGTGGGARADSKTFVDRPLTADADAVLAAFRDLPPLPARPQGDAVEPEARKATEGAEVPDAALRRAYAAFFESHFEADPDAGGAFVRHTPADSSPDAPRFLARLGSALPREAGEFATALKARWGDLCRVSSLDGAGAARSSMIPLPRPFFIAGGRFRECYYWDSYWIVLGLLASDMVESARDVADNLLHLVSVCGFVPNGNRVYYLNRSQPPMLALTVAAIVRHCGALLGEDEGEGEGEARAAPEWVMPWLRRALPLLDTELKTFVASHRPQAPDGGCGGCDAAVLSALCVYRVDAPPSPRPESWVEDAEGASTAAGGAGDFYRGIAAAAESGWDFSSRWFPDGGGLAAIRTPDIVPVCLNSILVKSERALAALHALVARHGGGDDNDAVAVAAALAAEQRYSEAADARARALNAVLWDAEVGMWCDWDVARGRSTGVVAASGLFPLWAGCWPSGWTAADAAAVVSTACASGLLQAGGVAATTRASGQQWDFPNAWPPVCEVVVGGLERLGRAWRGCGAAGAAARLGGATVGAMHGAWRGGGGSGGGGVMHEKYDARVAGGARGAGGEYAPQVGFGWTNGVALELMRRGHWPRG